jgi:hypothetical protein
VTAIGEHKCLVLDARPVRRRPGAKYDLLPVGEQNVACVHAVTAVAGRKSCQAKTVAETNDFPGDHAAFHPAGRVRLDLPDVAVAGAHTEGDMRVHPHYLDDFTLNLGGLARIVDVAKRVVTRCDQRQKQNSEKVILPSLSTFHRKNPRLI